MSPDLVSNSLANAANKQAAILVTKNNSNRLHTCTIRKDEAHSSISAAPPQWLLLDSETNGPVPLDTASSWNTLTGSLICTHCGHIWQENAAHADLHTAAPLYPFDPLQYEGDSVIYIDTQPEPTTNVRACTSRKRTRDQVQTLTLSLIDDMHKNTNEHSPKNAAETTDYATRGVLTLPCTPLKHPQQSLFPSWECSR